MRGGDIFLRWHQLRYRERRKYISPSSLILFLVLASSLLLVLPTIHQHLNDPNLIVYLNNDEGYQMDLIWSYYSGEIRDSYAGNVDYGLEMVYLSDLCRLFFSKFIDFTPATFVVMMRWLHLLGWLAALIAFWRLVGRHFYTGWQRSVATLLLSTHPAFAYFTDNNKPDFLVFLFMMMGLDTTLRLVDRPSKRTLLISVACAAIAVVIKFAGFYLLPAIVCALYLGNVMPVPCHSQPIFPRIRNASRYGFFLILMSAAFPLFLIFFYVRESTGLTFYQQLGFMESLLKFKVFFFPWGVCLILMSLFTLFLQWRRGRYLPPLYERERMINRIISDSLIVFVLFSAMMLIVGFRWFSIPRHFINTYVQNGMDFSGGSAVKYCVSSVFDFARIYLPVVVKRFISFDMIILSLLGIYFFMDIFLKRRGRHPEERSDEGSKKRLILVVYIAPALLSMFTLGRFTHYHALPFFAAIYILIFHGIDRVRFRGIKIALIVLLMFDISVQARRTVKERVHEFKRHQDVAFEIAEWWRKNIPKEALVVSDHMTRVYVPSDHQRIKVFKGYQTDRLSQLRDLVRENRPRYLYYNEGPSGGAPFPAIDQMLPRSKVRLAKVFESKGRGYQRYKGDKFLIYELVWNHQRRNFRARQGATK